MNTHNSRFRLPFVLGLVFMALLTACGGGDDAVARADKFTVGVLNSAPYMSVMVVNFQAGLAPQHAFWLYPMFHREYLPDLARSNCQLQKILSHHLRMSFE